MLAVAGLVVGFHRRHVLEEHIVRKFGSSTGIIGAGASAAAAVLLIVESFMIQLGFVA